MWNAVYGSPGTILTDSKGRLANNDFIDMCDYLFINITTTAIESPWSDSTLESNNLTLTSTVGKITEDTNYSLELAPSWALSAENSIQNTAGFSKVQLVKKWKSSIYLFRWVTNPDQKTNS